MTEIDQLIVSKLHVTDKAVSKFLRTNSTFAFWRDELLGAAAVRLVQVIRDGVRNDSHIMMYIKQAIYEAANSSNFIPIPTRTQRDYFKKTGEKLLPIKCESLPLDFDMVDPRSVDPLTDVLDCCKDNRERQIVEMAAAGHLQKDIAEALCLDPSRISQILKEIERRYDGGNSFSDSPVAPPVRSTGTSTKCSCGQPVKFSNETRCEDCYATAQTRWHGRSQRADIKSSPTRAARRADTSYALGA